MNHNKRYVFNGDWTVSFGLVKYTLGGNTVYYSGAQPENETIRIPSTLKTAVEIQVSLKQFSVKVSGVLKKGAILVITFCDCLLVPQLKPPCR